MYFYVYEKSKLKKIIRISQCNQTVFKPEQVRGWKEGRQARRKEGGKEREGEREGGKEERKEGRKNSK